MAKQEQEPFGGAQARPNILVIFGDDIGITNLSCYSDGLMGYETPNIDRIAKEGIGSCITTASSRAPRGARRSSPASTGFAPG
jgi:arylsulfatase